MCHITKVSTSLSKFFNLSPVHLETSSLSEIRTFRKSIFVVYNLDSGFDFWFRIYWSLISFRVLKNFSDICFLEFGHLEF